MNVVTGASGFIGSLVVDRLLALGRPVAACVRATSDLRWIRGKKIHLRTVDLESAAGVDEALRDATVVYHVAGVTRSAGPEAFRRGNRDASVALARAALEHAPGLRRFVYVSSLAAAGPARAGAPLDEGAPLRPVSAYGESKREAEEALAAIPALPWTFVRPPIVYGPRDPNLLPLFRTAARRLLPVVGGGGQRLSMIFGPDLAEGIVAAGEHAESLRRAYFLTGPAADWRASGRALDAALHVRTFRLSLPPLLVKCVGEVFEAKARITGVPQAINRRKVREMLEPAWTCSGERAARDLGFRAATTLEDGFARTAAWYRRAGWL